MAGRGCKVRQAALVLTAIGLVAVAGCGGGGRRDAAPSPPRAASSAPPVAAVRDEQLQRLCAEDSVSYPGSPAYAGAGPHAIRFYLESLTAGEYLPAPFPLGALGEQWSPSPASAQLAGCALRTTGGQLTFCGPYAGPPTGGTPFNIAAQVPVYRVSYRVKVFEVRTHRLVDTITITSQRDYACPKRIVPEGRVAVSPDEDTYVMRNGAPELQVEVTEREARAASTALVTGLAR